MGDHTFPRTKYRRRLDPNDNVARYDGYDCYDNNAPARALRAG